MGEKFFQVGHKNFVDLRVDGSFQGVPVRIKKEQSTLGEWPIHYDVQIGKDNYHFILGESADIVNGQRYPHEGLNVRAGGHGPAQSAGKAINGMLEDKNEVPEAAFKPVIEAMHSLKDAKVKDAFGSIPVPQVKHDTSGAVEHLEANDTRPTTDIYRRREDGSEVRLTKTVDANGSRIYDLNINETGWVYGRSPKHSEHSALFTVEAATEGNPRPFRYVLAANGASIDNVDTASKEEWKKAYQLFKQGYVPEGYDYTHQEYASVLARSGLEETMPRAVGTETPKLMHKIDALVKDKMLSSEDLSVIRADFQRAEGVVSADRQRIAKAVDEKSKGF